MRCGYSGCMNLYESGMAMARYVWLGSDGDGVVILKLFKTFC